MIGTIDLPTTRKPKHLCIDAPTDFRMVMVMRCVATNAGEFLPHLANVRDMFLRVIVAVFVILGPRLFGKWLDEKCQAIIIKTHVLGYAHGDIWRRIYTAGRRVVYALRRTCKIDGAI